MFLGVIIEEVKKRIKKETRGYSQEAIINGTNTPEIKEIEPVIGEFP